MGLQFESRGSCCRESSCGGNYHINGLQEKGGKKRMKRRAPNRGSHLASFGQSAASQRLWVLIGIQRHSIVGVQLEEEL